MKPNLTEHGPETQRETGNIPKKGKLTKKGIIRSVDYLAILGGIKKKLTKRRINKIITRTMDFLPFLGGIKGIYEGAIGKQLISNHPLYGLGRAGHIVAAISNIGGRRSFLHLYPKSVENYNATDCVVAFAGLLFFGSAKVGHTLSIGYETTDELAHTFKQRFKPKAYRRFTSNDIRQQILQNTTMNCNFPTHNYKLDIYYNQKLSSGQNHS